MNNQNNLTRREFLGTTGKVVTTLVAVSAFGPAILAAKSPNETIGVGCIGLGTRGGGYVFNQIHNIQTNVPPENILAMFDAAHESGAYGG